MGARTLFAVYCATAFTLLGMPAFGDVEYRYQGNAFDTFSCGGNTFCSTPDPELTSYTTADSVRVSLLLSEPLPGGLQLFDVTTLPGFSLVLNDGHQYLTVPFQVWISTDAEGNIIQPWSVMSLEGPGYLWTVNWPGGRGVSDTGALRAPHAGNPDLPYDKGQIDGSPGAWSIHPLAEGQYFTDIPPDFWAYSFVQDLSASGVTAGCGNRRYCPDQPITRAQMAVFLVRVMYGSGYTPPPATGTLFDDVAANDFAASYIEQLARDRVTRGCGNNNFCPDNFVTRAQMSVFLLRAKLGLQYAPPPPSGVFDDVPIDYWAAAWIEELAAKGITSGCGNGNFCPDDYVTRAQMAVFLVRCFPIRRLNACSAKLATGSFYPRYFDDNGERLENRIEFFFQPAGGGDPEFVTAIDPAGSMWAALFDPNHCFYHFHLDNRSITNNRHRIHSVDVLNAEIYTYTEYDSQAAYPYAPLPDGDHLLTALWVPQYAGQNYRMCGNPRYPGYGRSEYCEIWIKRINIRTGESTVLRRIEAGLGRQFGFGRFADIFYFVGSYFGDPDLGTESINIVFEYNYRTDEIIEYPD